jgi:hypothetical protein
MNTVSTLSAWRNGAKDLGRTLRTDVVTLDAEVGA